jgi:hypothetical protein
LLALAAACSSKSHAIEDARSAQPPPQVPHDAPGPYRIEAPAQKGDVQIRVEWKDVPLAARASPGTTPCNTPRVASVAPTTTWGVPDAVVMIDVDHGAAPSDPHARVVLDHCALSPRIVVAGPALDIASNADAPAQLALVKSARARPLGASLGGSFGPRGQVAFVMPAPRPVQLPIAGHTVHAALEPDSIYTLSSGDELATIVVPTTPYVAVTEATGQVVVRDVPVGTHSVAVWLPERGGQPARGGHGTVTVTADALAEITVELAPSP